VIHLAKNTIPGEPITTAVGFGSQTVVAECLSSKHAGHPILVAVGEVGGPSFANLSTMTITTVEWRGEGKYGYSGN
jgi:hypothetical protein